MKLMVAADFHGAISAIDKFNEKVADEKPDLIVICGDITNFGSYSLAEDLLSILSKSNIPIFFVPGNCDPPDLAKGVKIEKVVCLHGACKILNDINFVGVGGSNPSPFLTPFEINEDDLLKELERAYSAADKAKKLVLISHAPPLNTKLDIARFGGHVGSVSIRHFIETKKPLLAISGHIHEANGVDILGSTTLVNPGPAARGFYTTILLGEKINVKVNSLW